MIQKKTQMKINRAVAEYIDLWGDEYRIFLQYIDHRRANMKNDMAGLDTHNIQRALFSIPERLSIMIGIKLTEKEMTEFAHTESALWFAKNYPQFRLTKEI
jgi:hypothetical protein